VRSNLIAAAPDDIDGFAGVARSREAFTRYGIDKRLSSRP